jgi:hypothetical protein
MNRLHSIKPIENRRGGRPRKSAVGEGSALAVVAAHQ